MVYGSVKNLTASKNKRSYFFAPGGHIPCMTIWRLKALFPGAFSFYGTTVTPVGVDASDRSTKEGTHGRDKTGYNLSAPTVKQMLRTSYVQGLGSQKVRPNYGNFATAVFFMSFI